MKGAQDYLLLFADLVGSTDVAVEASPISYSRTYVASYHWAARRAHEFILDEDAFPLVRFDATLAKPRVAGDEVLSFTPLPPSPQLQEDIVGSAVAFAYVTKLFWLVSPYNLQRLLGKQFPRDVAVGIHVGPAVELPRPDVKKQIASLHINIAKRIEGFARDGRQSRIFASYEVKDLFHRWVKRHKAVARRDKPPLCFTRFVQRDPELVKGIPKPLQLFELEWNSADKANLRFLLGQLRRTPRRVNVAVERAARRMMEIFLPPRARPFALDAKGRPQVDATFGSVEEYIERWFEGIGSVNRLFFDEYWLVISSYLVSCGMLRHSNVASASRQGYVRVAKQVCDRLQELAEPTS